VVLENGLLQTGIGGADLTLKTAFSYFFGLSLLFPFLVKGFFVHQKYFYKKRIIQEMDWASGVCLAVTSDVFQHIPGFPEDYFMYAEDVALGRSIRGLGKIIYYPLAKVRHTQGNQTAEDRGEIGTLWLESLFRYFKKKNNLDSSSFKLFLLKLIFLGGFSLRRIGYGLGSFFQKGRDREKARRLKSYSRYVFKNLFRNTPG
jgi:GT2 family glycosyltransferase